MNEKRMFSFLVIGFFGVFQAGAVSPIGTLSDCPKVLPQNDLQTDKIIGTWRLAYMYVDDLDDMEEDNTCAVVEILKLNKTQLQMLLFIDNRKEDFAIDRYTEEFNITLLKPGEWLISTSFKYLEFVYVTVVDYSSDHLVLTFCAKPFVPDEKLNEQMPDAEPAADHDWLPNAIDKQSGNGIFKSELNKNLFRDLDGFSMKLGKQSNARRMSRFIRGTRKHADDEGALLESGYEKTEYLRQSKTKPRKHLWTTIFVKNNKVSLLKYVENASLLLKYGFKIDKGQLVSFGSCSFNK